MLTEIKVPTFAESVSEATLMAWQKQPGDTVQQGDLLIELETDKVVLEVTAPGDGVLKEIKHAEGDVVGSEEVLAVLDSDGASATRPQDKERPIARGKEAPLREKETDAAPPQVMSLDEARREGVASEPPVSPSVRRLLAEHGLTPLDVDGSGKDGRILKSDVLDLVARREAEMAEGQPPPAEPASPEPRAVVPPSPGVGSRGERREPVSRLRARVAERLVEAQQTAALLTTFNEVDMAPVKALRARHQESFEARHGVRLGFMSFFAKAAVSALTRFPKVNAYLDGGDIVYHDYCDIGIAIGSERGLVVPILRNVETLSFAAIEQAINAFADRAGDGKLAPEDLMGGTFTITNGGVFGSLLSTPIVNPPQTAILGMHKIQDRPVARDGEVVIRPMMYLALSYDHRLIDGREAVQFLVAIKEALEDPVRLLLEL
ncbi:MAG: 2-oxoglutarate dehydrogenase complex dihydrolipoyllysine-residue succinyltransferase [Gammaproteobacteria bacterium]|nr:2-oxoglutarate dehydrogenase complex dihydrolipoyllysine-residue succinyltransferase [Gammaproteobacteria bacterium]